MLVALLSYKSCNVNLSAFLSLNMVVECHSVLFVGWVENPDLKLLLCVQECPTHLIANVQQQQKSKLVLKKLS